MQLLHEQATARTLAKFRILVFGIWFIKIFFDPFPDLAACPTDLFRPPGVLKILPDTAWTILFTPAALWSIKITLLTALAGAAAGWRFRLCAATATLLLVFQQGLVRGFTYIYHEEMPLLYAAALLTLFPCNDALSLRPHTHPVRDRRVYTAALLSVAAMVISCFCFTGIHRCVVGGLELFRSDSLRVWILRNASLSPFPLAQLGPAAVAFPFTYALLKAGLILTTLLEVGSPFVLVSRPLRRFFVPVMLLFLVLNALLMNVVFWETALLLAVLVDRPQPAYPYPAPIRAS